MSLSRNLDDENHCALPNGLVYAMLDDNLLVRRNLERIIKLHLKGDVKSFSRGDNMKDCQFFPHELFLREVDVAIFDENLDFGDTTLYGSMLASKARQLGFKGCAVLHSAHAALQPDNAVFDGFVEKTASRHILVTGLESAWASYHDRIKRNVN